MLFEATTGAVIAIPFEAAGAGAAGIDEGLAATGALDARGAIGATLAVPVAWAAVD